MYVASYARMSSSIVNVISNANSIIHIFFKNSTLNSAVVDMCSTVINTQECRPI